MFIPTIFISMLGKKLIFSVTCLICLLILWFLLIYEFSFTSSVFYKFNVLQVFSFTSCLCNKFSVLQVPSLKVIFYVLSFVQWSILQVLCIKNCLFYKFLFFTSSFNDCVLLPSSDKNVAIHFPQNFISLFRSRLRAADRWLARFSNVGQVQ